MDVLTKATGTVTPVEDSTSKHGEFDVVLSTAALDRDGDQLHPDEWKTPLPDKITFDSDHGMSVVSCVGSGKPFINQDGELQVRGTFASTPHGQSVRTLVKEGHISNVSVAFMESKTQKSGRPQRELLNGAFVAVPANPEARVLSSKAIDDGLHGMDAPAASNFVPDEMNAVADMFGDDHDGDQPQRTEYWQGVHDVAVKLGAGCPYSDPQDTPGVLNGPGNRSINSSPETKSGASTETTDDLTASTADAAETADDSADDVALLAKRLAIQLRATSN